VTKGRDGFRRADPARREDRREDGSRQRRDPGLRRQALRGAPLGLERRPRPSVDATLAGDTKTGSRYFALPNVMRLLLRVSIARATSALRVPLGHKPCRTASRRSEFRAALLQARTSDSHHLPDLTAASDCHEGGPPR
jgi:hypothetical protein